MSSFRVSPYAPANETSYDLYVERLNLYGYQLGAFGHGVALVIAIVTMHALWILRDSQPKFAYILLTYVFVIFSLGTIGNAGNLKWAELAFVENREYPGGPNAYFIHQKSSLVVNQMCSSAYVVVTWMQDGFILYRFLVVFNFVWYVSIVPVLVFLFTIIMSCLFLAEVNGAGSEWFSSVTTNFALGYLAGSIATTLLLTTLIVGKLLYFRLQLRRALGPAFDITTSPYLTISAMLIESACLYSAFTLPYLILFSRNDPFQNIFLPIAGQGQVIAPLLIIMRVAQGRGFTENALKQAHSTIVSRSMVLRVSARPSSYENHTVHVPMDVMNSGADGTEPRTKGLQATSKVVDEYCELVKSGTDNSINVV
ncbi:hypothetical protein K488DRAFT_54802 [Vararia minispora EC-137]|uniref:Uncharacterized protein n=1 Tax=Vararia minispora EC-137 TaxID=1314806 RepID=A0ACB8QEP6_9AGAM|nr:hypothetical protein K488DRAFT_54802 [Vararia minispora EC-137]